VPRAWASTSSAEKERPLAVQNFQVRGGASPVTHDGQPDGLLQIRDRVFLANPDLVEFLIADQRVGYVRERAGSPAGTQSAPVDVAIRPAANCREALHP